MPSESRLPTILLQALALLIVASCLALLQNNMSETAAPEMLSAMPSTPGSLNGLQEISPENALALHQAGAAIFIDARENLDYQDAHVPGAASVPVELVGNDGPPLPVIIYCSDPSCGKAEVLAERLARRGFEVRLLPEGVSGWAARGGPLEAAQ